MASQLFATKSVSELQAHAETSTELKRSLGWPELVMLGIAAINAGPSVALGFVVAALGCAFAGLCYAEFASLIPIAGSAYTYSYATMGEFMAGIIGWDLVLEYAIGAATVGIAWSQYLNKLLPVIGLSPVPYEWCHSPFESI